MITKKKIWVAAAIVVFLAAAAYYTYAAWFNREFFVVSAGRIINKVSETGRIVSSQEYDLSFGSAGEARNIYVSVGQRVSKGDVLAELDKEDLEIQLAQARARKKTAEAKLSQIIAGSTIEEIQVAQTAVANAQANLDKIKENADNQIKSAESSVSLAEVSLDNARLAWDNAKNNLANVTSSADSSLDNLYDTARTIMRSNLVTMSVALTDMDNILGIDNKTVNDDFDDYLGARDEQTQTEAENSYKLAAMSREQAASDINNLSNSSPEESVDGAIIKTKSALNKIIDALEKTKLMLDYSVTGLNFTLTELNTKKSTIDTDRSSATTALADLETAEQNIIDAKNSNQTSIDSAKTKVDDAESSFKSAQEALSAAEQNLEVVKTTTGARITAAEGQLQIARDKLTLIKAEPRSVDKAIYLSQVEEAQTAIDLLQKQLVDVSLKAPVDSIITKVNIEQGERVLPGQAVISLIADSLFELEVYIAEENIVKISPGQEVEFTLDAFSKDERFKAVVESIEPASTIIEDEIYYKVKGSLEQAAAGFREGLTADVDILIEERDNVLIIPTEAIIEENGQQFVWLRQGVFSKEKRSIKTGLSGNGFSEIVGGLRLGEQIIID